MNRTDLTAKLGVFNGLKIRQEKPGYSESYYNLMENLAGFTGRLLPSLGLCPESIRATAGENGAILMIEEGEAHYILKIGIWEGELFTSSVFYEKLANAGVSTPRMLHFDVTKRLIPYEFQVLEVLAGSDVDALPPSFRKQAGRLMGQTLRRVHAIAVEGFGAPLPTGRWSCGFMPVFFISCLLWI
jgi:hypothetical protein